MSRPPQTFEKFQLRSRRPGGHPPKLKEGDRVCFAGREHKERRLMNAGKDILRGASRIKTNVICSDPPPHRLQPASKKAQPSAQPARRRSVARRSQRSSLLPWLFLVRRWDSLLRSMCVLNGRMTLIEKPSKPSNVAVRANIDVKFGDGADSYLGWPARTSLKAATSL